MPDLLVAARSYGISMIADDLFSIFSGVQTIGKAVEGIFAWLLGMLPLNLSPEVITIISLASIVAIGFAIIRKVIKHIAIALIVAVMIGIFIFYIPLPS